MKINNLKVAAKSLIRSAAAEFDLTPLQLLKLYHYSDDLPGSRTRVFANLLRMAKDFDESQAIKDFVQGRTTHIDLLEKVESQLFIDQCTFLFHTIDNFYLRGHTKFTQLSFYPRLEDLFPKPKAEPKPKEPEPHVEVTALVIKSIPWNAQQRAAFAKIHAWLRDPKRSQIFRLFGYAGTGKTEMSKEVANFVMAEMGVNNVPTGVVLFSAYTGKACSVMRVKGCRGADTLHSMLYKPIIDDSTGMCTGFATYSCRF